VTRPTPVARLLRVAVDVRPPEVAALGWAWLYFFCVLSSYYVIRPIRDELGIAGGVNNLPWLFMGTLAGMILSQPLFASVVSRLPRKQFISWTYRFFMMNLVVFFILMKTTGGDVQVWVGRVFFVWVSVFNMFVVSIFWATMVDLFTQEQSKRLFGFIAAGATIGAITGAGITFALVEMLGTANLLLVSVALLELAVFGFLRLTRAASVTEAAERTIQQEAPVGGGAWSGVAQVLRSPYLLGICLYMLLFTTLSTFLYFQQASIVEAAIEERTVRAALLAQIDLAVNLIALFVQTALTGRIVRWLGIPLTMAVVPALTVTGFAVLATAPVLGVLMVFQVLRRAGEYALARPTREILFTTVTRAEKYKAKSFIDTFVYRTGDQIGAWSYAGLAAAGLGVTGVAWLAVPVAMVWALNGWALGRAQEKRSAA
jgi:AAA family ATP:ADP antiporter